MKLKTIPIKKVEIWTEIIIDEVIMPGVTGNVSSIPRFRQTGRNATLKAEFINIPEITKKLST